MFPVLSLTAVVSGHPVLEPGTRHQCYMLHNRQYRQCVAWLLAGLKANSYPNLSCRLVLVLAWCRDKLEGIVKSVLPYL